MTFVAQPYERFVDDLLTALTGGVIREEHQFLGTDQSYVLSSPGVLTNSVKVFGQYKDEFRLFEGGIDYQYDSTEEAIRWKPDGKIPDEQTYFYVNFYLQETVRRLTDRNPGSVTTTVAEAFAREYAVLHKQMEAIYFSAFVDFATGVSLDHIAALFGMSRKDAKFASGEALCKRSSPAEGDISIPAATVISTDTGQDFETTDRRTLRKGQLSVIVPIRAQVEGPSGRTEPGTIKNINRPIFGIDSVVNEEATFFATAREPDEEFRRRIKGALERAGKATVASLKYTLIEDIPGLNDGNVEVKEDAEVNGKVQVRFGLTDGVNPELVRRIEESIFYARPAGVRVVHNLPSRSDSLSRRKAAAQISRIEARSKFEQMRAPESIPADIQKQLPEGILPLRILVFLQLAEANISVSESDQIQENVRSSIISFVNQVPMGSPLIYNRLVSEILQLDQISDVDLLVGSQLGKEGIKGNLATDGRKVSVDAHDIFVGLMDETVFLDVLVNLMPKTSGDASVPKAVHDAIEDAINRMIAVQEGTITRTQIRNEIANLLAVPDSDFQLIAGESVVLNVEYKESGRRISNGDAITLQEFEVPELRNLNVEIPGALDGKS